MSNKQFINSAKRMHAFFINSVFLNSVSVLLHLSMNWASNVAEVLLHTYNHHYNETHFTYSLFVFTSRSRSICVVSLWYVFFISVSFSLPFIIYPHLNRCTCFWYIFNNISYYFWMITLMKKTNNFPIAKVQPQDFA